MKNVLILIALVIGASFDTIGWVAGVAMSALLMVLWHEFENLPATGRTLVSMQERVNNLQDECVRLEKENSFLALRLESIEDYVDRQKDPIFYQLLDDGDGHGLYELEKSRGFLK